MMSPVEAKLLGYWAPVEGMKTDALVLQPDERLMRRQEAWDMWMRGSRMPRGIHECFLPRRPE